MGFFEDARLFLDDVANRAPDEVRDVLFESKQASLGRAVAADLIDAVPILGDASNIFRVRHAEKFNVTRPRRFSRQLIDLAAGALPDPLGGIIDLITPTNTLTYLREELSDQ